MKAFAVIILILIPTTIIIIIIIIFIILTIIITINLRSLDDNPSPEWKVSECLSLKLLPAPHPTQTPLRFWSRPADDHTDEGHDADDADDDEDGDDHTDDVDGGKDEDLPNVAVALRDSAVSLLDIQLEIIAIMIFLVIILLMMSRILVMMMMVMVMLVMVVVTLRFHSSTSSHCRALPRWECPQTGTWSDTVQT